MIRNCFTDDSERAKVEYQTPNGEKQIIAFDWVIRDVRSATKWDLVFGPGLSSVYFPSSFFYWTDKVSVITPATGDNT